MDPQSSPGPGPAPDSELADKLRGTASPSADAADDREEALWEGGYSGKAMYGSWLGAVVITVIAAVASFLYLEATQALMVLGITLLVVWGGLGLVFAYHKLSVHYQLTNQRFIHKSGILNRVTDRIEVIDIDDVTYSQGLVQRMLGVGTIRVISSDRSHPQLHLRGIDDVERVATLIDDTRRKERRRRGLHIEAI